MSAPYLVTGAVIPSSLKPHLEPPTRWEIRHLEMCYSKQFTLFILSFLQIMDDKFQPKAASFREIAGIHGMPYVPWLGDPDEARQTTRGSWLGYCNHASILFPGWHRPYVMVLEQIISDVAHGIASRFAEKDPDEAEAWTVAADILRFPFWDWTDPSTGVEGIPEIFQKEQLELDVPPGEPTTYKNPLAYYELNRPVDGFDNRWQPFGGKVTIDKWNKADNDTAGFDPIFFLHHCNVDRLLAFWEHIYPDYVAGTGGYLNPDGITRTPFTQSGGTWVEKNNQEVNDASPLWPFRNLGYDYWTTQYGHSLNYYSDYDGQPTVLYNKYYTYPPIKYVDKAGRHCEVKIDTDPTQPTSLKLRRKQRYYLQKHFCYDPPKARDEAQSETQTHLVSGIFTKHHRYTDGPTPSGHKVVDNYRQFFVSVSLDPTFIRGSYMLVLSIYHEAALGRPIPNEDTSSKLYEIGRVAVLSRGSSEACGNCQAQRAGGVRVRGIIMIPHLDVHKLLVAAGKNDEKTTDIEVIEAIKITLVAQLVLPNGLVHSRLQDVGSDEAERSLSGGRVPYLELLSSDVYQEYEGGEGQSEDLEVPYDFEDWKSHDALHTIDKVGGERTERRWVLAYE
ncbi:unnamed protein product [Rhizoctonia solani]|uniref:tyrosinase n=1 Tax=Rhizoctonia solani TaxID=456999 RepID=A0A8H3GZI6_9AGAM|nr:unnamed protein product [Rhizoctonia solani]